MGAGIVFGFPPDGPWPAFLGLANPQINGPGVAVGIVTPEHDPAFIDEELHAGGNQTPAAMISLCVNGPKRHQCVLRFKAGLLGKRQALPGAHDLAAPAIDPYRVKLPPALLTVT